MTTRLRYHQAGRAQTRGCTDTMKHSISTRLIVSFALLLLMMAAMGSVSIMALRSAQQRHTDLIDGLMKARVHALRLEGLMHRMASDLRSFVLYEDEQTCARMSKAACRPRRCWKLPGNCRYRPPTVWT